MSLEQKLVDWLRKNLPLSDRLRIGIGDDAAELCGFPQGSLVATTDTVTDQVDFLLDEIDPRQVGHKALGVNLSDLAAMAARPVAALVSLVLPNENAFELARELYEGMLPLAERYNVVIAGGDMNTWDGPLAISITALGEPTEHGTLTRSGAKVGDWLLVTGQLGGSILGRHLAVEPRVDEALLLNERYELHAGIDISDGLSLDATRLAAESQVGVALEPGAIPVSAAARQLSLADGAAAIEHALGDGEDFELLLAVPPSVAQEIVDAQPLDVSVTRVGEVVEQPGLWQVSDAGQREPLVPRGFEHGAEQ